MTRRSTNQCRDDDKREIFLLPDNAKQFPHIPLDQIEPMTWTFDKMPAASSFEAFVARLQIRPRQSETESIVPSDR